MQQDLHTSSTAQILPRAGRICVGWRISRITTNPNTNSLEYIYRDVIDLHPLTYSDEYYEDMITHKRYK